jgi:hypothetical protein
MFSFGTRGLQCGQISAQDALSTITISQRFEVCSFSVMYFSLAIVKKMINMK